MANEFNLRLLADWLHVSADELRFGTLAAPLKAEQFFTDAVTPSMQDRDMLKPYFALSAEDRKTAHAVIVALQLAATVKSPQ